MVVRIVGVGPIRTTTTRERRSKVVVVAIDYFTRWVEVEPLVTITVRNTTKFLLKTIVCRFEIPYSIILDNGRQFDSKHYWERCTKLGIW